MVLSQDFCLGADPADLRFVNRTAEAGLARRFLHVFQLLLGFFQLLLHLLHLLLLLLLVLVVLGAVVVEIGLNKMDGRVELVDLALQIRDVLFLCLDGRLPLFSRVGIGGGPRRIRGLVLTVG